jgi:hypothetical protein
VSTAKIVQRDRVGAGAAGYTVPLVEPHDEEATRSATQSPYVQTPASEGVAVKKRLISTIGPIGGAPPANESELNE